MLGALWGPEAGRGTGMGECLYKGRGVRRRLEKSRYLGLACESGMVLYLVFDVLY